jgi:hypothetical protein
MSPSKYAVMTQLAELSLSKSEAMSRNIARRMALSELTRKTPAHDRE